VGPRASFEAWGREKFLFSAGKFSRGIFSAVDVLFCSKIFYILLDVSLGFPCRSDLILFCFIIQKCLANDKTF